MHTTCVLGTPVPSVTAIRLPEVLDVDGSDTLGIDEFVQGLLRVTESSLIQDRHILVRRGSGRVGLF